MKKVTWLRTLVTAVLSVTVVSMIYVFTKGWPLMRPPRTEDIKEVTMIDIESGIKKEFGKKGIASCRESAELSSSCAARCCGY